MAEDRLDNEPVSQLEPVSQPTDQAVEEDLPIPPEVLENMPPEMRSAVIQASLSTTQFSTPVLNPVLQRVRPEHITQIINNVDTQSNREAEAEKSNRRYQFSYFIVTIVVLLALLVFFAIREQYNVLIPVVTGITGLGSGFGIGKLTNRR